MSVSVTADLVRYPLVRHLHDYWLSKCADEMAPRRQSIDPVEIKGLLPYLVIAEPSLSPFRIRYRLVGTAVAHFNGFDFTGLHLDEMRMRHENAEDWHAHYLNCYESGLPILGVAAAPTTSGGTLVYGFGIFPLRQEGGQISQFIAVEDYAGKKTISDKFRPITERHG